jgi:hypothetical protein
MSAGPTAPQWASDVGFTRLHVGGSDGTSVGLVVPEAFKENGPTFRPAQVELLLDELKRIGLPVAIQEKGPAWHLHEGMEERGIRVVPITFEGFVAAGEDFNKRVIVGSLTHSADPILTAAVEDAQWRDVSGRRVLSRKFADISALESVVLALRGTQQPVETREFWGAIG